MTTTQGDPALGMPEGPRPNPFSRIAGAIIAPVDTFRSIAERPDWLVPLILILLFSLASTLVITPHIDLEGSMRKQVAGKDMSEQQIQKMIQVGTKMQKFNAAIVVVAAPIVLVVIAAVILFAFRAFGGEGTFKQAFAITLYAWIPFLISGLLLTILVTTRGQVLQEDLQSLLMSNPGAFLTDANRMLTAFLSSLDVFTFWVLALMVLGFSSMSGFSRRQSSAVVVSLWLVVVLFKVAFAAVAGMMGKS